METEENMRKLAKTLQKIWKQTDKDVDSLEGAFLHHRTPEPLTEPAEDPFAVTNAEVIGEVAQETRESRTGSYNLITYANLAQLVDELNMEQITEILQSAPDTGSNHYYLTRLAEKLTKERDSRA
jgi:intergrase/recombinase